MQAAGFLAAWVHSADHGVAACQVAAKRGPELASVVLLAIYDQALRALALEAGRGTTPPDGAGAPPLLGPEPAPALRRPASAQVEQAIGHGAPLRLRIGATEPGEGLLHQGDPELTVTRDARKNGAVTPCRHPVVDAHAHKLLLARMVEPYAVPPLRREPGRPAKHRLNPCRVVSHCGAGGEEPVVACRRLRHDVVRLDPLEEARLLVQRGQAAPAVDKGRGGAQALRPHGALAQAVSGCLRLVCPGSGAGRLRRQPPALLVLRRLPLAGPPPPPLLGRLLRLAAGRGAREGLPARDHDEARGVLQDRLLRRARTPRPPAALPGAAGARGPRRPGLRGRLHLRDLPLRLLRRGQLPRDLLVHRLLPLVFAELRLPLTGLNGPSAGGAGSPGGPGGLGSPGGRWRTALAVHRGRALRGPQLLL
mmetsp:Transcript_116927/g.377341  ORF Transcript_116927/g.377341 Transcript_116927/m.377341 type:complete len:422 (+) Transcript_116927:581-1846(+)